MLDVKFLIELNYFIVLGLQERRKEAEFRLSREHLQSWIEATIHHIQITGTPYIFVLSWANLFHF